MREFLFSLKGIAIEGVLIVVLLCMVYFDVPSMIQGGAVSTNADAGQETENEKDYIKWVEFNVTSEALQKAYEYDVESYGKDVHIDWIEVLAYLGAKYGGDFGQYQESDMTEVIARLTEDSLSMDEITRDMQYYTYYHEAYGAVLGGMVGEYEMEAKEEGKGEDKWTKKYGLKAFHPIAKGFPYSDYDDFGVSRSYGYKRNHLGHDMMGQVGTPVKTINRINLKRNIEVPPI